MKRKASYIYLALAAAFLLGNYRGYIALWSDGTSDPIRIFPYCIASLPPEDQSLLAKGIRVRSGEHLRQLLEDYLS